MPLVREAVSFFFLRINPEAEWVMGGAIFFFFEQGCPRRDGKHILNPSGECITDNKGPIK